MVFLEPWEQVEPFLFVRPKASLPGSNLASNEDSGSRPVSLETRFVGGTWDLAGASGLDITRSKLGLCLRHKEATFGFKIVWI